MATTINPTMGLKEWLLLVALSVLWGALLGLALLSTALAYLIFFRILAGRARRTSCWSTS